MMIPNYSTKAMYEKLYALGEAFFLPQLRQEKLTYSWQQLVATIEKLAE